MGDGMPGALGTTGIIRWAYGAGIFRRGVCPNSAVPIQPRPYFSKYSIPLTMTQMKHGLQSRHPWIPEWYALKRVFFPVNIAITGSPDILFRAFRRQKSVPRHRKFLFLRTGNCLIAAPVCR